MSLGTPSPHHLEILRPALGDYSHLTAHGGPPALRVRSERTPLAERLPAELCKGIAEIRHCLLLEPPAVLPMGLILATLPVWVCHNDNQFTVGEGRTLDVRLPTEDLLDFGELTTPEIVVQVEVRTVALPSDTTNVCGPPRITKLFGHC